MGWFIENISLSYSNIKIFSQKETYEILEVFLNKYCRSSNFHYFWSNFKKAEEILIFKIIADDLFYTIYFDKVMSEILKESKIMLAIDKSCNISESNNLLLSLNKQDLKHLLIEFYWELDEICIFDNTYKWFIAINHCFEVYLYGDPIIKNVNEIIFKALAENIVLKVIS